MIDKNISNSGLNIFSILQKLLTDNCSLSSFDKTMSKDSFIIYIETLRKCGFDIVKNSKSFDYTLKNNINMISLSAKDIKFFSDIKKLFLQSNNYRDVISYNNFLSKLLKYTDNNTSDKITNILEKNSIRLSEHKIIFRLENYIKDKIPLLITHNSNSVNKNFKIFPLYLKLENSKLYLWGIDNTIEELRCLRVDKILNIEKTDGFFKTLKEENFAICEFYNQNYLKLFDENNKTLLKTENDKDIVKVYFSNKFEFFQKILNLGDDCKILESQKLIGDFKQIIYNIEKIYE